MTAEAAAFVGCSEPARLAARLGRHFAHKVPVSEDGAGWRVELPTGRLELEPRAAFLEVRASASDEDGLARVRDVAASHLVRFARPEAIEVSWGPGSVAAAAAPADPLEAAAEAWVAPYWNAAHLVRTRDWVVHLDPRATAALRLAALTHDIERHFPGGPRGGGASFDDANYLRAHSERSAGIVCRWLAEQGAPSELVWSVCELVTAHETGGWRAADLLQAADSLSFLEVNADLPARWVADGRASAAQAAAKLGWMCDRIAVEEARRLAARLRDRADARLRAEVGAG